MQKLRELKDSIYKKIKKHPRLYFWYLLIKNTILEFNRDGCLHLAAGIAFFGIFSIFPILLISISGLGFTLGHKEALIRIIEFLQKFFPSQIELITNNIETIAQDREKIGVVGILILLWTGRGLFLAMEHSLNRTWGNPHFRSVIGRNLLAFFLIFMMGLILGLSMLASTTIVYLTQLKVPVLNISLSQMALWGTINKWLISTFLIFIIFVLLFKVLPHIRVSVKEILPGAIFSTICCKIAEFGYIWYMKNMANLSAVYGSIGGILGMLLWIYILAIVFLLGAEFNIVYLRIKSGRVI